MIARKTRLATAATDPPSRSINKALFPRSGLAEGHRPVQIWEHKCACKICSIYLDI